MESTHPLSISNSPIAQQPSLSLAVIAESISRLHQVDPLKQNANGGREIVEKTQVI